MEEKFNTINTRSERRGEESRVEGRAREGRRGEDRGEEGRKSSR